jgi:hypothetical protein
MTMPRRHVPADLRTGSQEQAAVIRVLRSCGWKVYATSDLRWTRSTPGILDLICFKPNRVLFWDSKAGSGKPSKEQMDFMDVARRAGAECGWGNAEEAMAYNAQRVTV